MNMCHAVTVIHRSDYIVTLTFDLGCNILILDQKILLKFDSVFDYMY